MSHSSIKPIFTYPAQFRLKTSSDFQNLRFDCRIYKSSYFIAYYKFNSLEHGRLGISVSRKKCHSPRRSCFKRVTRECFRLYAKRFSCDLLVVCRKPLLSSLDRKSYAADLMKFFDSLNRS